VTDSSEPPPEAAPVSRRALLWGGVAGGTVLAAAGGAVWYSGVAAPTPVTSTGRVRQFWLQADAFRHALSPTGKDGFMGGEVRRGQYEDLDAVVAALRQAGARFRNDIVTGLGGRQILLEDPAGNPVELFELARS
jgi:hypothetical protein